MRYLFLIFLSIAMNVSGQRKLTPTEHFSISGQVKKTIQVSVQQLDSFPKTNLKDRIIYNHKGEAKDTLTHLRGVALKTVLEKVIYNYEKPRELNEFYFVFTASDGYKVVFSWNEIYNNPSGNGFYFVTEINHKSLKELPQRILLLAQDDEQTGRRYIKSLEKIEVRRAK
ncbi:MAG: molybdopterin-binding protein [Flavobacteriaceae bacterium]